MIIVTGASGFIGSNLIKELLNRGERNIRAIDYETRNYNPTVIFSPADDFYSNLDQYCKGVTAIFHEGAISSTTETDWKKLFDRNVRCTWNLIYYCRDNNIPLQYASSASVYGNPSVEEWHNPNKKMNPLNLYAKSKQQIDYVADLVINSSHTPTLLQGLRYFNVYGPNEDHKGNQSSPHYKFQKQFDKTGTITLFEGSKEFYRDFISVKEVIDQKLYHFENSKSGIYDIGTGNPRSFYDIAIEICKSDDYINWIPMPENLKEHYQKYTCAIRSDKSHFQR